MLKIGVIGGGYWGPNLVRNFNVLDEVDVSAVCDSDPERLKHFSRRYPAIPGYHDFIDLLSQTDVDAIVIATPVHTHFEIAKAALEEGKHVLLEKPMASSVSECEELIRLADEKGLTLMVDHTYLYSGPIRKILEIISAGDIGTLRYVNSQRLSLGLFQEDVNVVWDLAPHDLSIILRAVGDTPSQINCQGNANVTQGIEDVANISLKFSNSAFATIQNSWLEPRKVRQIKFVGTRRTIIYDDLEPLDKIRVHDVRVERPPHYDTFSDFQYSYHYGDTYIPRVEQTEPLSEVCRHFCECIRTQSKPLSDGHAGLDVVRILEATTQSLHENGAPVNFSS